MANVSDETKRYLVASDFDQRRHVQSGRRFPEDEKTTMQKPATTFATIRTPSSYPASQKRCIHGSRADLCVPYRELSLSPTHHSNRLEENPPVPIYDTSGPYTDPEAEIDLARGLPALRSTWIQER
jgi:phosphomethylpyrimidine synthase